MKKSQNLFQPNYNQITEPSSIPNVTIHVIRNAYKQAMSKTISSLCHGLIASRKESALNVKAKWGKELYIDISDEDWDNICSTQQLKNMERVFWGKINRIFYFFKSLLESQVNR